MRTLLVGCLLLFCACDDGGSVDAPIMPPDGSALDRGMDAGSMDAGSMDATVDFGVDALPADAAPPDAAPDVVVPPPEWPWLERTPLAVETGLAARHPRIFGRMSRWSTSDRGQLTRHTRGAFGVGNGRIFGLFGQTTPLNTLHGVTGPIYDRPSRFFGDYALALGDAPLDEDTAGRSLAAPVVVTRAQSAAGVLWTHDFAVPETPCIARHVEVSGLSAPTRLIVRPRQMVEDEPDRIVERADDRVLSTTWVDGGPLDRELGGDDWQGTLLHCAAIEAAAPIPAVDVDAALAALLADADARAADRMQLVLPDPLVADLLAGWLQLIDVQTAETGAVSPMSRYTRFWTRDTVGPLLAFLAVGDHAAATRLLDYLYGVNLHAGTMRNSYGASVELADPPPAIDWAAQGPLEGRVAAESPSYLPLMHAAWLRATGDLAPIRARWDWLTLAIRGQLDDAGRLPFSGDETFRLALNLALGLGFEHPHESTSWSANSNILWLAAQRAHAWMATVVDAAPVDGERVDAIASALTDRFDLGDGCYAGRIDRATDTPSAPFEDAQLKAVWAGWLDGDDPAGRASVTCLLDRMRLVPGVLQSPLAERYRGVPLLPVTLGVRTGMQPGYTLAALTRIGHSEAFDAFAALAGIGPANGSIAEYHGTPGGEAITLIYDPTGIGGDSGARFRPWEAGIVYAAAVEYLFGIRPDAPAGVVDIRPHLPPGWPEMAARGARMGNVRFDVVVTRDGDDLIVELTSDGPLLATIRGDGFEQSDPPGERRDGADQPSVIVRAVRIDGPTQIRFSRAR